MRYIGMCPCALVGCFLPRATCLCGGFAVAYVDRFLICPTCLCGGFCCVLRAYVVTYVDGFLICDTCFLPRATWREPEQAP